MALSIDGIAANNTGGATSLAVTLTTTLTNDVIIVDIELNGTTVSSITSSNGLTYNLHKNNGGGNPLLRYYAIAASALASETITVNMGASAFCSVVAYGINGANTTTPFDAGGPQSSNASPSDPISITTVNANTMVIAGFRMSSTPSPTHGTGFTEIFGSAQSWFIECEYKILTSAQTLSCTLGTGAANSNGSIVDAIVAAQQTAAIGTTLILMGVG